ncbi:hypothetical protein CR513_44045, partial [Mucuna pruriens]
MEKRVAESNSIVNLNCSPTIAFGRWKAPFGRCTSWAISFWTMMPEVLWMQLQQLPVYGRTTTRHVFDGRLVRVLSRVMAQGPIVAIKVQFSGSAYSYLRQEYKERCTSAIIADSSNEDLARLGGGLEAVKSDTAKQRRGLSCPYTKVQVVELGVQTDHPYILIARATVSGVKDNIEKGGMRINLKERRQEEEPRVERKRRYDESPCQRNMKDFRRAPMYALKCGIPLLQSNEATMTRFLHGLNKDIQDVVELYHYTSMAI